MQRLEAPFVGFECTFGLRGISLCSRVGEIYGSLRIVVILRAATNDIRIYTNLGQYICREVSSDIQYTGAGIDTERVERAYT